MNVDVLYRDFLLALAAVATERLYLRSEGASKLVEGPLGAILLWNVIYVSETAGERHRCYVDGSHLGCEHRFYLILRLYAFHNGKHEVKPARVCCSALRSRVGELLKKTT